MFIRNINIYNHFLNNQFLCEHNVIRGFFVTKVTCLIVTFAYLLQCIQQGWVCLFDGLIVNLIILLISGVNGGD